MRGRVVGFVGVAAAAWSGWVVEGEIGSREEEAAVLSCSGRWSYELPKPSWRNWKEREKERGGEGGREMRREL